MYGPQKRGTTGAVLGGLKLLGIGISTISGQACYSLNVKVHCCCIWSVCTPSLRTILSTLARIKFRVRMYNNYTHHQHHNTKKFNHAFLRALSIMTSAIATAVVRYWQARLAINVKSINQSISNRKLGLVRLFVKPD